MNRLAPIAPKVSKSVQACILTLDIETRPHEAYVWSLWKQNVGLSQLMERGHVMCFVAKWYGDKNIIFRSDHHDGHESMIQAAWDLLNEADLVVTYNGVAFDLPHLYREFALAGLTPPAPHKDIDLIKTVRKRFRFGSNKLANVVHELGVGGKMETGGFELWKGCIDGDPKAWDKMRRYNMTDVKITEKLYDRLRPWIQGHPHLGLWVEANGDGESWACPTCGHKALIHESDRTIKTNVQQYRAFRCPKCGHQIRGNVKLRNPIQTRSAH